MIGIIAATAIIAPQNTNPNNFFVVRVGSDDVPVFFIITNRIEIVNTKTRKISIG